MPLIQVKLIEHVFTDAQKRDVIKKLTDTTAAHRRRRRSPSFSVVTTAAENPTLSSPSKDGGLRSTWPG